MDNWFRLNSLKKVILVESGSVDFKKDIQELNNHKSVGLEFRKTILTELDNWVDRQIYGQIN